MGGWLQLSRLAQDAADRRPETGPTNTQQQKNPKAFPLPPPQEQARKKKKKKKKKKMIPTDTHTGEICIPIPPTSRSPTSCLDTGTGRLGQGRSWARAVLVTSGAKRLLRRRQEIRYPQKEGLLPRPCRRESLLWHVCLCVCVPISISIHASASIFLSLYLYLCIYIYIYIFVSLCIYVCMHACTYVGR